MSSLHRIRWKGRTAGPYSRDEIRAKLDAGEFSLLHRVEADGRWIGLDEFLSGVAPGRPAGDAVPPPGATTDAAFLTVHEPLKRPLSHNVFPEHSPRANVAYFLCGLCFVLPLLATVAAGWSAWELRRAGDKRRSDTLFALAALFTILGAVFWSALIFAWSRGVI